jgi:hypothetical protein
MLKKSKPQSKALDWITALGPLFLLLTALVDLAKKVLENRPH